MTVEIQHGRPSLWKLLGGVVVAAGAAGIGYTLVSAPLYWQQTPSIGAAVAVTIALLFWWTPVVWWVAWKITLPVVLVAGIVAAAVMHRYRPPLAGPRRVHRLGRVCRLSLLIYGGWMVGVGVILLASLVGRLVVGGGAP